MIFAKAAAVLKKDILTSVRYRSGFFLKLVSPALQLATFYYLARAVGPQFRPDGMPYVVFLIVGTGFYTFLVAGIHSFLQTIQDSQQTGTLEVLMATSTPTTTLLLLSALSSFAGNLLQFVVYVGSGILLFAPAVNISVSAAAAVLVLSLLVAIAIGLIMAPAAYHRLVERNRVSKRWLRLASRDIAWAMAALTPAISIDVYLVSVMSTGSAALGVTLGAGVAAFLIWLWFAMPLRRHHREHRGHMQSSVRHPSETERAR